MNGAEKLTLFENALKSHKKQKEDVELILANGLISTDGGKSVIAAIETLDLLEKAYNRLIDAKKNAESQKAREEAMRD